MPCSEPFVRAHLPYFAATALRWNDCGVQGHVNNAVPFQLFDTVVNFWQIDTRLFHSANQPIRVVVSQAYDFFAEIPMTDKITVGPALDRFEASSIACRLGLFVNDVSRAAMQGEYVHVVINKATRKATPIPDFARRAADPGAEGDSVASTRASPTAHV
jgi:acyl-CoA thioester hydrolase